MTIPTSVTWGHGDDGWRLQRDEAIASLFDDQYGSLVRLARLLINDSGTAEEVVQDAFVGVFRAWRRLRDVDAAVGYLRVSVLNLARSRLRRKYLTDRVRFTAPNDQRSVEDDVMLNARQSALLGAVRALPRRQRECLILRYYLDFSESEIADALKISKGSVKSHSHRGLKTLASTYEREVTE